MSWFDEDGGTTNAETSTQTQEQSTEQPKGDDKPDLSGKPDWIQDQFWIAPKEGGQPDYPAMLRKANDSFVETRKKVSDQGEQLAKYTVPDSVAPYLEGLEVDALLKANERAGWTPERVQQFMAQARAAGVGPAPAQVQLQAHLKSRHEATELPKTPEALAEAAIAELNGQGRPGSEMAKRIRSVVGRMVTEGTISKEGAEALVPRSAAHVEALNAILGMTASGPAGRTDGRSTSVSSQESWEALQKRMGNPKLFGDEAPAAENAITMRMLQQHEGLVQQRYGSEVELLEKMSATTHPAG